MGIQDAISTSECLAMWQHRWASGPVRRLADRPERPTYNVIHDRCRCVVRAVFTSGALLHRLRMTCLMSFPLMPKKLIIIINDKRK